MPADPKSQPEIAVPKFVFDRPASPDGAAFEMFRAASLPHFTITLRDPADAARFSVNAVTYQLPHAILTHVRGGRMVMRRAAQEIASDPNPPLLNVHIQLSGDSDGHVGDRPLKVRAGDILFYDYARTLECDNSEFECITLLLARNRAHPAFLHPLMHGAMLQADSGAASLVTAVAQRTHALLDRLTVPQADHAVQSLADFAGRMLEQQLLSEAARIEPLPAIKAGLAFIDSRLDDNTLSPAAIAEHLALSRSALYRTFEPFGGVENAIRQRRLDRAMRAILTANGHHARKTRAGFANEEQFARAFQARFGARPTRYREMVQANRKDWLMQQARRMGFETLEAWIADLEPERKAE